MPEGSIVKIAIDYDFTYTADPDFWDAVIRLGRERGHQFICVTGRDEPPGLHERQIPVQVICSPSRFKCSAALERGHVVDVWIDDAPGTIEPAKILQWGDEDAVAGAPATQDPKVAAALDTLGKLGALEPNPDFVTSGAPQPPGSRPMAGATPDHPTSVNEKN